jgi:hypothetical protein
VVHLARRQIDRLSLLSLPCVDHKATRLQRCARHALRHDNLLRIISCLRGSTCRTPSSLRSHRTRSSRLRIHNLISPTRPPIQDMAYSNNPTSSARLRRKPLFSSQTQTTCPTPPHRRNEKYQEKRPRLRNHASQPHDSVASSTLPTPDQSPPHDPLRHSKIARLDERVKGRPQNAGSAVPGRWNSMDMTSGQVMSHHINFGTGKPSRSPQSLRFACKMRGTKYFFSLRISALCAS